MKHTKSSEESMPRFLFRLTWSTIVGILFVIPSFAILYILNDILRAITNYRLKKKYGPNTVVLEDGCDAVWLYKVQNGKRLILYLAINDDPIDLERHRQHYVEKMLNRPAYQKLKQIFTVDFGFNIQKFDVNFNIRNHVKIHEGTESRIVTEEDLIDNILPVLSEEMDDSKPQWEDVIIPHFKYNSDDEKIRSARVFRIHHAFMDGGSNLLMIADCQYEGEGEFPYVVDPMAPLKIALWKRALYKLNCLLLFGWVVIHGLYAPTTKVVRNRFRNPNLSGQTNYGWSKPIPMELLKQIKSMSGESMPTILMSVLGGAICRLNEKYPSKVQYEQEEKDEITIGMVAGVFPYPDYNLKNRHSIFHVKVDVSEKTAWKRLKDTSETMQKVMWDPHVYLNLIIPSLFGRTPIWFSDACMEIMGFPLVLSNIPVAQKQVKLWDNNVLDIGGWPPMLTYCGIGLVIIRYGNSLRICLNSDNNNITKQELKFFISQFEEVIETLSKEVEAVAVADSLEKSIENAGEDGTLVTDLPFDTKQPLTSKKFEEGILLHQSADENRNSLKFRLNASINTIKDSLSKFREP